MQAFSLVHLDDHVLDRELGLRFEHIRTETAMGLAYLAEFDARERFLPAGYPSMFRYCVDKLCFSEDCAAKAIHAARAARRFPAIFPALAEGRLSQSAVVLLAPHLTPETAEELLAASAHQTKSGIALLLAERLHKRPVLAPGQPFAAIVGSGQHAPGHVETPDQHAPGHIALLMDEPRLVTASLSAERLALQGMIPASLLEKILYARTLLSHSIAPGNDVEVLERALDELIAKLEKRKFGATTRPRPRRGAPKGRHVPAEVRRAVHERDGGRCTFVGESGHRCESRERLEFDHVEPVARGGQASVSGMRLLCRAHNQYAAECAFGAGFMERKRQEAKARAAEERNQDLIPYLRALGFRDREAREGARHCAAIADSPIEARMKRALSWLAPNARRSGAAAQRPADAPPRDQSTRRMSSASSEGAS